MAEDEELQIPIEVPPEHRTGIYANLAAVSTQTPHDITLDFAQMLPGESPHAVVVARLKLAPTFLMPLMQILSSHLAKHEAAIREAQGQDFDEEGTP